MGDGAIRFISIDDHPAISEALRSGIDQSDDLTMVGSFTSLEAVPRPLRSPDLVDVVLLDLNLPGQQGLSAVEEVAGWDLRVLVFSATALPKVVEDALRCGAAGFVSKALQTPVVLDAVRATHRGERPVVGVQLDAGPSVHLTASERQLLDLLCEDSRSKDLARKMSVSSRTVDNMVTDLYTKVGLEAAERSRASLRDWARGHGFGTR